MRWGQIGVLSGQCFRFCEIKFKVKEGHVQSPNR